MTPALRRWLESEQQPAYRSFQHKLLPGVENYLGVPLPVLRKKAAALARQGWQQEFSHPDETFEEQMLRGMVIGQLKLPVHSTLALAAEFVPHIANWSVCDSFCAALKGAKQYQEEYFCFIQRYVLSKREFEARFAAVMLLMYYRDAASLERSLAAYRQFCLADYYAWMAVAWGYSVFAATDFDRTLQAMEQAQLPRQVWNKALQKMRESRRIRPQQKQLAACKWRQKEE